MNVQLGITAQEEHSIKELIYVQLHIIKIKLAHLFVNHVLKVQCVLSLEWINQYPAPLGLFVTKTKLILQIFNV